MSHFVSGEGGGEGNGVSMSVQSRGTSVSPGPSRVSSPSPSVYGSHHRTSPMTLAHYLLEAGPKSIHREYFLSIISQFGPLKEGDVAQVLGMMAATQTSLTLSLRTNKLQITNPTTTQTSFGSMLPTLPDAWLWSEFIDHVVELFPYLNWTLVIQYLDYSEFFIHDIKGVEVLVKAFYWATKNTLDFPIFLFWKPWENLSGQLSFLRHALMVSPELMVFAGAVKASSRRLLTPDDVESQVTSPTRHALVHLFHQPWNALEFLDLTCHLLDNSLYYEDARSLLELAAKQAPELLCLGLAVLRPPWTSPIGDLLVKLALGFLAGQPGAPIVLPRLWRLAPSIFMSIMSEMHRRDSSCLSRLLDIAQELKALPRVLAEARPFSFTIDLAALASRREHLNLDKWLQEAVRERREPFIRALVDFVTERTGGTRTAASIPLSPEALSLIMRMLGACLPLMSPETAERYSILSKRLGEVPRITTTVTISEDQDPLKHTLFLSYFESLVFPSDIEVEANACYERIYAQESTVSEVLATMERLKASSVSRDNSVFVCMIHNLLDEYRFFSKYPEKELALTGVIFGLLIHHGLLNGPSLGIALRFICDSIRLNPIDSKLWRFGLTALAQCASDLARQWPSICVYLLDCPGIASFPPISERLKTAQKTSIEDTSILIYVIPGYNPPQSEIITDVMFLCLSSTASKPLMIEVETFPISLNEPAPDHILQDRVFFVINNLSMTNVISKSMELGRILSNEGYVGWFISYLVKQRISIEPNYQPLYISLLSNLNFSEQALRLCLLAAVIQSRSILCKEEASGSSSDRLILKNLGGFIGLLTLGRNQPLLHRHIPLKELLLEAFDLDNLLIVVPFACKILEGACRSRVFIPNNPWLMAVLSLLIELYTNGTTLKLNLKFEIEVLFKSLSLDMSNIKSTKLLHAPRTCLEIYRVRPIPTPTSLACLDSLTPCFPGLINRLNIPIASGGPPYSSVFYKALVISIEFAIREVATTVLERAVSIAISTSRTLVLKDFKDFTNVSTVFSTFIGCLVRGICRDPFRVAFSTNMNGFGGGLLELEDESARKAWISAIADENIEFVLAVLEKHAIDKGIYELTKEITTPIITNATMNNGWSNMNVSQMMVNQVYDELTSLLLRNEIQIPTTILPPLTQVDYDRASLTFKREETPRNPLMDDFILLLGRIERIVNEYSTISSVAMLRSLPPNHELRALMKDVLLLALHSPSRDEACLSFSQHLISNIFKEGEIDLFDQIQVILLDKLCEMSSRVLRELTQWVIYSNDEWRLNVPVILALFAAGLVSVHEYDVELSKHIDVRLPFAVALIRRCCLEEGGDDVIATPFDMKSTLCAIEITNPTCVILRDSQIKQSALIRPNSLASLEDFCNGFLVEWERLCQVVSASEKAFVSFVFQLFRKGICKENGLANIFWGVLLRKLKQNSTSSLSFSKLVIQILKYQKGIDLEDFMGLFFSLLGQCIEKDEGDCCWARNFLSGLLVEWHGSGKCSIGLISLLCQFLHTIRPSLVPGFSFWWLEIISHRFLLGHLLGKVGVEGKEENGFAILLLLDALGFMGNLVSEWRQRLTTPPQALTLFYKGLLRVLLLILHDFPEWMAEYHSILLSDVPPVCIQLANLISSAFPRTLTLPDPFRQDLKIEDISECIIPPIGIQGGGGGMDSVGYINNTFIQNGIFNVGRSKMFSKLSMMANEGWKSNSISEILIMLSVSDDETSYLFVSAMASMLRYPNSHTLFFSRLLRGVFDTNESEHLRSKELITRVLLERLIVNRPHPWGLLVTFMDLIRSPDHTFWALPFTRSSPYVERLFDSVARSCSIRE